MLVFKNMRWIYQIILNLKRHFLIFNCTHSMFSNYDLILSSQCYAISARDCRAGCIRSSRARFSTPRNQFLSHHIRLNFELSPCGAALHRIHHSQRPIASGRGINFKIACSAPGASTAPGAQI